MQNKTKLLTFLATNGPVANPKELVTSMDGLGVHAIVHLIWACQKQGLLTFKEGRPKVGVRIPTKITITQKGRELLDREA